MAPPLTARTVPNAAAATAPDDKSLPARLLGPGLAGLAAVALLLQVEACVKRRTGATLELLTFAIVFGSALVTSVVGFAFSALAGAGLMQLYAQPSQAVEIMVVCSISIQLYCVVAMWRSIQWRLLLRFLLGGALALPAGVWLLSRVPYAAFATGLGAFLLVYGAFRLWRKPTRTWSGSVWVDMLVGALGGITGGLAAFPSAFLTIWCGMRGWDKTVQRGVTQPYILFMQLMTLLAMRATHIEVGFDAAAFGYVVAVLFAAHVGIAVFRSLGNRQFAWLVNALLMVSGAVMVVRVL
jgi:uncharacterized membrane protein YfcA